MQDAGLQEVMLVSALYDKLDVMCHAWSEDCLHNGIQIKGSNAGPWTAKATTHPCGPLHAAQCLDPERPCWMRRALHLVSRDISSSCRHLSTAMTGFYDEIIAGGTYKCDPLRPSVCVTCLWSAACMQHQHRSVRKVPRTPSSNWSNRQLSC